MSTSKGDVVDARHQPPSVKGGTNAPESDSATLIQLQQLHKDDVTVIKSFVPDCFAEIVDRNVYTLNNSKLHPVSKTFIGACMIADISGFTRLSGSFCAMGKEGIDGLQSATNGYMGILVDIIYEHGGDVIKFAGDALLCIFKPVLESPVGGDGRVNQPADAESSSDNTTSPEAIQRACINAVKCAWKLKDVRTPDLTLHVGISAGKICVGLLGGYENRWECLIAGECLQPLSQCLDDAPSQHVAITPQCLGYLMSSSAPPPPQPGIDTGTSSDGYKVGYRVVQPSGNILIESLPDQEYPTNSQLVLKNARDRLHVPDDHDYIAQIDSLVPFPVTQSLLAGTFDLLAELREVTTMFMKWDGYDPSVHEDLRTLQGFLYAAQEILAESGGFVRQFIVDDKGAVLIALWGVPTATHPNNCRRAVWAATTIHTKFNKGKKKMPCSFGITTGNVFCGTVGSYIRREYAAIGDVVNLAARFMGKAKGYVYIDQVTYDRLSGPVQSLFTELPEMMVKGKDVPLVPFKYTSHDVFDLSSDAEINKYNDDGGVAKTIEEPEVREICRNLLLPRMKAIAVDESSSGMFGMGTLTRRMSNFSMHSTHSTHSHHSSDSISIVQSSIHSTSGMYHQDHHHIHFVIIEGKVGTGRGETAVWTRFKANALDLHCVSVSLQKADAMYDYRGVQKIFRALIKEENYDDIERQSFVVNELLNDMYPKAEGKETREKVAFPAMQIALGLKCDLANSATKRHKVKYQGSKVAAGTGGDDDENDPIGRYRKHKPKVDDGMGGNGSGNGNMNDKANNINRISSQIAEQFFMSTKIKKSTPKLPASVVSQCVLDILCRLLSSRPTVLMIEESHELDELSWRIILQLVHLNARCLVVMMQEPISDLTSSTAAAAALTIDKGSSYAPESFIEYDWLAPYMTQLMRHRTTVKLNLPNYTIEEVRVALAAVLRVPTVSKLPKGLDQTVYQLSGGNPFWVKEILSFISQHGAHEFVSTMEGSEAGATASDSRVGGGSLSLNSRRSLSILNNSRIMAAASAAVAAVSGKDSRDGGGSNSPTSTHDDAITAAAAAAAAAAIASSGADTSTSTSTSAASAPGATTLSSLSSSKELAANRNQKHSQLEFFVVCRFEKLSIDSQTVIKTAAIVGMEFSIDILCSILPKQQVPLLGSILTSLVETQWLVLVSHAQLNYVFTHKLIRQTLYDLTPTSLKQSLHQDIAMFMQANYDTDPYFYRYLGYHFSKGPRADEVKKGQPLAFQYYTRSAYICATARFISVEECIELVLSAETEVSDAADMTLLISVVICAADNIKAREVERQKKRQAEEQAKNDRKWSPYSWFHSLMAREVQEDLSVGLQRLLTLRRRMEDDLERLIQDYESIQGKDAYQKFLRSPPTYEDDWQEDLYKYRKRFFGFQKRKQVGGAMSILADTSAKSGSFSRFFAHSASGKIVYSKPASNATSSSSSSSANKASESSCSI